MNQSDKPKHNRSAFVTEEERRMLLSDEHIYKTNVKIKPIITLFSGLMILVSLLVIGYTSY